MTEGIATTIETQSDDKYRQTAGQFGRYLIIGLMNAVINFIVLNILSYATGITSGAKVVPVAILSFGIAAINSYYFNKAWSFRDESVGDGRKKFSLFFAVSILGAVINAGTVYVITTAMAPLFNLSSAIWLNVANVVANGLSIISNFLGYKWIVFKK